MLCFAATWCFDCEPVTDTTIFSPLSDQANADDPTEISFSKGEILDIVDNSGECSLLAGLSFVIRLSLAAYIALLAWTSVKDAKGGKAGRQT